MKKPSKLTQNEAETLALRAFAYLASSEDDLERFMALTGMAPEEMKAGASDPSFLAGVLDYYLNYEPSLLEMCSALDVDPTVPALARQVLQSDHYTEPF